MACYGPPATQTVRSDGGPKPMTPNSPMLLMQSSPARRRGQAFALASLVLGLMAAPAAQAASAALLGWNNLGMHCMDSDYSVFSILPPYNTVEAQLIVNGRLVKSGTGYRVTYEAVADPDGSINSTSIGKGNFYAFTPFLYGPVAPDLGLLGWAMPGLANTPQSMLFEANNSPAPGVTTPVNWFRAEGIPISPIDDALNKNEYPLARLVARNSANAVVASSDVVLPVSDEMDCRACHGSGTQAAARPLAGWVTDPNPEREYRLNILRLHDDTEFVLHAAAYTQALADRGFDAAGLYPTVIQRGQPILCASCHASEALPGSGLAGIPPLTQSMHGLHANVADPVLNTTLNDSANRAACYRCHPGSETKCLRGAMGNAIAADGSMEMQCQSCHGSMSQVGSPNRVGWFMEPNCQSCHTGTATQNNGQIRYTSVFTDAQGTERVPVNRTFATTPNTPAPGLSLYRFSVGHGGLQCSACHGSTHAEFPSASRNDNIASQQLQGHAGVVADCTACHTSMPSTVNGGPHGMHPIGQDWVDRHHDLIKTVGLAQCQGCHGADSRGTVLSRAQGARTFNARGAFTLFRGATVGCYNCHNGPSRSDPNPKPAPVVSPVAAVTAVDVPVSITLPVTGAGAVVRIVSQATHGSVGLAGHVATYYPESGFAGTDTFTFAAYDGGKNSALASGTITVGAGSATPPAITTQPSSQTVTEGANVVFTVVASGTGPLNYQWQRDGSALPGATTATLALNNVQLAAAGSYQVVVSSPGGSVASAAAILTVQAVPFSVTLSSPVSGTTYREPADVKLSATVVSAAGVRSVEFFDGSSRLGSDTSAPFAITARRLGSGTHVFTARAKSLTGAVVTSAPVRITVTSSNLSRIQNESQRMVRRGSQGAED